MSTCLFRAWPSSFLQQASALSCHREVFAYEMLTTAPCTLSTGPYPYGNPSMQDEYYSPMPPEAHAIGRPGDFPVPSAPGHAPYSASPQNFSPSSLPPPPMHNRPPRPPAGYSTSQAPGSSSGPLGQALNLVGNVAGQGAKNSIQNLANCECDDDTFPRTRLLMYFDVRSGNEVVQQVPEVSQDRVRRGTLDRNLLPMLCMWCCSTWMRTYAPTNIIAPSVRLGGGERFSIIQHNKL